jgi:ABC-type polysaccharide/polyol phosphate transport system ATPase subunit
MSRQAVTVENIGKLYKLGLASRPTHLRDAITGAFSSIYRKLKGFGEDRLQHEDFWALKNVSFEVQQGEAIGILGRNGAGKSTLLKVLSRITEPTEGIARLRGRVGSLLEVGTGFHPELTGRENIYLNGSILGMKRAEINRKFDEIVAFSEVERFLDTPVKRYSSGMFVRLAFAVAAHLEPEILVVDEVLAVGDLDFQKRCLGKMNDVVGHGRTVFFVSHNTQSIAALTSRCLVFKQGRMILDAPTDQAIKHYVEMSLKGSMLGQPFVAEAGNPDSNYIAEARVLTSEPYGQQSWGEPLAFEFVIHVGIPMARLCFMFWIANSQGAHITHCWQFDVDQPYQSKKGDYRLRCEIPKLRLYKGSYSLTAWISDTRGLLPIDARSEICQFEVHMGSFHRQGFEWRDEHATYLEEAEWTPVVEL